MAGIEVEVFGVEVLQADGSGQTLPLARVRRLCAVAAGAAGVGDGHLAIEFVDADRIAELNIEHRGKSGPTDVLSFPIDGADSADDARQLGDGQRELGDVVICPRHTVDVQEAVVHGVLHLVGLDHETDAGEMLALQAEIMRWEAIDPQEDT
jgi:probable rRNA maturation factor